MGRNLNVLLIAPYFDRNVPGESWCTYKWVEGISERCNATVLTSHAKGWNAAHSPVSAREIINWTHPVLRGRLARIDYELKPHYVLFYLRARRWLKQKLKQGFPFDLVHQINPVALRYPSPAGGLKLNYLTGPHAGSLETPPGFLKECPEKKWYRKLRKLDSWRLRHDPLLKRSFRNAQTVLGVAPYVSELLSDIPVKHFECMAETGPETIIQESKPLTDAKAPLKLLFVGRIIRTKGVIDAIRAVAKARHFCRITFDIVGTGDMEDACRKEAVALGVQDIVTFHGRLDRSEVFRWYQRSDVFLFPSFREPSGTVVFEALGYALPLIACNAGGPGHVVNDTCGLLVNPVTPEQYVDGLASAIVQLTTDRTLLQKLSAGSLKRVRDVASWPARMESLMKIYAGIIKAK